MYNRDLYFDKGEYFLYSFNDAPDIIEIVLKLYSKKRNHTNVLTLTGSYGSKYNIYGFAPDFIVRELGHFESLDELKRAYPQYFI